MHPGFPCCTFETMVCKLVCLWFMCIVFCCSVRCQQYSFTNYSVGQGLVQSQARDIVQDEFGYIWIATLGGLSRFDGLQFRNYTRKDGLHSLITFRVHPSAHRLYIGTQNGLEFFNGRGFQTCSLPKEAGNKAIADVVEANDKQQLCRVSGKLYTIKNDAAAPASVPWGTSPVTALAAESHNNVFAAVYKKGVYKWQSNQWQLFFETKAIDSGLIIQQLYFNKANQLMVVADKGIYTIVQEKLVPLAPLQHFRSPITCVAENSKGQWWIGTTSGAWLCSINKEPQFIGSAAGLTDNAISAIITDREGNSWFATDGDGIFKLNNSPLSYLNSQHGMKGNVVMGLAAENDSTLWLGTSEHGLQQYANGEFTSWTLPSSNPQAQKTNSLLLGKDKQLWIGTLGGGLWCRKNGAYREIITSTGGHFKEIISIYEDSEHTIWVCTPNGLFYYYNGSMVKVKALGYPCFSVFEQTPGKLLAGTTAGLFQVVDKTGIAALEIPRVGIVNCFSRWRNYILLGTEDEGVVFWDAASGKTLRCNAENGLSSDFVFSLYADTSSLVFAGTEHGVSSIGFNEKLNQFIVKNHSSLNSPYGPECNLNAVQKGTDGKLWFGTVNGMVLYTAADTFNSKIAPLIYLKTVRLFSDPIDSALAGVSASAWHQVPDHLHLSHHQNHLTFDFEALYFSNSSGIRYRYRLQGADTAFSAAGNNKQVIYSNLAPGKYRFMAYAIAENGLPSSNQIDFSFQIDAPFYQQWWFRLLAVLLLIVVGILLQYFNTRLKAQRAAAINKIKMAEQLKIQERTAEDLHDDLGNSITRISVLADVLAKKIKADDLEKRKLVQQIRENANALYTGTKDIIWSLTPGNDSLYDLLERCRAFGIQLFEDSHIEFSLEGQMNSFPELKLPLQTTRNLMMIVKEALNNVLKHSGATQAVVRASMITKGQLQIVIADNGSGMAAIKIGQGNGLENIRKRTQRIGGAMEIVKAEPAGTQLHISVPVQETGNTGNSL